jgi:hypothetical protein
MTRPPSRVRGARLALPRATGACTKRTETKARALSFPRPWSLRRRALIGRCGCSAGRPEGGDQQAAKPLILVVEPGSRYAHGAGGASCAQRARGAGVHEHRVGWSGSWLRARQAMTASRVRRRGKAETAWQGECGSVPGARIGLENDGRRGTTKPAQAPRAVQAMPLGGQAVAERPDPARPCCPRP